MGNWKESVIVEYPRYPPLSALSKKGREVNKMNKKIIAFAMLALLMLPVVTFAQTLTPAQEKLFGVDAVKNNIALGTSDIRVTIAKIINVALGLLGIVCVVIVIAGGVMWMTSAGEAAKTDKAKGIIIAGIIGLAIILSAYAIASFVISNLVVATQNPAI